MNSRPDPHALGHATASSLDAREIELRKRWLSFAPEDEELIADIDQLLEENIGPLIEDMYAHFLSFDETRRYFPDDQTLQRAQNAQARYFLRLTKGNYDDAYVRDRLAVGSTHYSIGLDPKWYLGAYNRVLTWLRRLVREKYKGDTAKYTSVMSALTRVVFFDMSLAIDSYMIAKEANIKKQRDAIRELETSQRVTKSVLENAPVGIVQTDRNLQCLECNDEFAAWIARRSRDQIIGKTIQEVAPGFWLEPLHSVLETGTPFRISAHPIRLGPSDAVEYIDWYSWPVRDETGSISAVVSFLSNATDRVRLQQQREDFVATLTHDLKTPILAANRAVKLLMEGDFGPVETAQQEILANIHQSNEALYKLVQTLLDVYRYDSGAKKLKLGDHDVQQIIAKMIDELRPLAISRSIELSATLESSKPTILCDEEEIRRVVQNLIDNALKFTSAKGTIHVTVNDTADGVMVKVSDTGKGISDEDKPKLFQRFWAASSSGRYYASTGLGLYLCRRIVELHGGEIGCESQLGKGSTFFFSINPSKIKREQE